ncbi:HAD hydrolase-like protein [Macellibacteroides fermentans]|jgi:beta-phosphoglucomutase-like phosphatase (HAD superfamily)|uniref:HAD hydrolase-like protein n=1 Tax=Macellibacteroides fermentans TaxID=879969 RepID=UPI00406D4DF9
MGYKHLFFDMDGTLVDYEKAVVATWQETILQLFGKRYETAELIFVLGIPGVTTMVRLGAENP